MFLFATTTMVVRVVMVPVTYRSDDPTDSWGVLGIARDLAQKLAERMAMKHQKELHIANSRAARAKLKGAATKFTQMLELSPILELFLMRERRSVVISNSDPENSACQRANHRLDVSFNRLSARRENLPTISDQNQQLQERIDCS